MAVTERELLDAIETGLFLIPELPGRLESLSIPGLLGRAAEVPHPLGSMVGAARLEDGARADAVIRQVCEFFAERRHPFGWVTGPGDTPADLPERLQAARLSKVTEMAGMALTDLEIPIRASPTVSVREMGPEDAPAANAVLATGFDFPKPLAELLMEAMLQGTPKLPCRQYLAFVEEREDPVAVSLATRVPGTSILMLSGAATLPEYRGRGVYTSMVARRIADGRAEGCEAAIIQAVRATSAPICARIGFREVCGLAMWVKMPPES
jgi:hypothetical protein